MTDQLAELRRIAIVPALNEEETVGRVIDAREEVTKSAA